VLKSLGKSAAVYGGADLLFKLMQLAVLPVYARLLTVADFGVMALLTVSATLLGILANLGTSYAVTRYYFDKSVGPERRPLLVSTGLIQLVLNGIVIVGAAGLILSATHEGVERAYGIPLSLLLLVLATVLPDQIAQYSLDTSRLQFAPYQFFLIAMLKNLVGLLLGLWLIAGVGMGIAGYFAGALIGSGAAGAIGLWLIRRDLVPRFDPALFRQIIGFGSPFVFTAAAYWVFGSIDRWLLIELSDAVEVGLFSIALKFASGLNLLVAAFHQAWIPVAMRMAAEEERYREVFARVFSGWFFLLAFVALGLALFAEEIMKLLTPAAYWPAAPALAVGAAAVAVSGTTQMTTLGLTLEKRTGLLAAGAWTGAAANVALNLLLIPHLGAVGSALATLLTYSLLTLLFLRWSQRLHPLPLETGKLLYGCAIVAVAAAAPFFGAGGGLASLAAKAGLLALAFVGAFATGIIGTERYRQLFLRAERPT
jgi:O-antigen/teichoic acid export membrane protein